MYNQQKSMIQKILDDNSQLILLIIDLQAKGKQNECLEHQRTLYKNLNYLVQFDSAAAHHLNNLSVADTFNQTQSSTINGNIIQQNQSDQIIYRTQSNGSISSNILNQNLTTNSINKPTIPTQRTSYIQQGGVVNGSSMNSSYPQSYVSQQSHSIQQNGYGQYPNPHQQNTSTNTQNLVSNSQVSYNNYNDQQMYHPQQSYLTQQQWQQNQPRMLMQQQQQQYTSYQPQLPP